MCFYVIMSFGKDQPGSEGSRYAHPGIKSLPDFTFSLFSFFKSATYPAKHNRPGELLHVMRGAVAVARDQRCFPSGRVDTPTYSVAFNGTGYTSSHHTCARNVRVMPACRAHGASVRE